jgi:hypothetical protein
MPGNAKEAVELMASEVDIDHPSLAKALKDLKAGVEQLEDSVSWADNPDMTLKDFSQDGSFYEPFGNLLSAYVQLREMMREEDDEPTMHAMSLEE